MTDSHLVMYTIPFSHFCELARWSLDAAGRRYTERPYLPGLHMVAGAKRLRSKVQPSPATSLPLVACGRKPVFIDSWAALEALEPTIERGGYCTSVRDTLDKVVGPCVRTWVYSHFLNGSTAGDAAFFRLCTKSPRVPYWQRRILSIQGVRKRVGKVMYASMVQSPEQALQRVRELESALEQLWESYGEEIAVKEGQKRPTMLQIAVAALVAPLLMENVSLEAFYGKGADGPIVFEQLPLEMQAEANKYQKTPVGKAVKEIYHKLRQAT